MMRREKTSRHRTDGTWHLRTNRSVLLFGGSTVGFDREEGDARGVFAQEYRRANVRPLLDERGVTLVNVRRHGDRSLKRFWGVVAPLRPRANGGRSRKARKAGEAVVPTRGAAYAPRADESVLDAVARERGASGGSGLPWEEKASAYRSALDKALADGRIDDATYAAKLAKYCA